MRRDEPEIFFLLGKKLYNMYHTHLSERNSPTRDRLVDGKYVGKPGKGFLQEFQESNIHHFSMYITKIIEIGKPFFSDHYLGELASYLVCF